LTEINDAIVIRGKVSRATVAKQIVEIAEQFYPRVLDQMQPRAGEAPANGEESPAIGTEIRELRTDVKSLRDEIRKLIKVMEQPTKEESINETSLRDLNTPRDKADLGKAGDIRVAIMCHSGKPVSTKHPTLAKDLSDFISSILKDRAIETASRQLIEKWQATNPFRNSPTETGRGAGATHVLLIEVADYGLYEKQSDDLFRGHVEATVSVLDTARTDNPRPLLTETLNSRFPIAVGRSASDITEAEFRGDFNTRLAFEVARFFSDAQSEFAVALTVSHGSVQGITENLGPERVSFPNRSPDSRCLLSGVFTRHRRRPLLRPLVLRGLSCVLWLQLVFAASEFVMAAVALSQQHSVALLRCVIIFLSRCGVEVLPEIPHRHRVLSPQGFILFRVTGQKQIPRFRKNQRVGLDGLPAGIVRSRSHCHSKALVRRFEDVLHEFMHARFDRLS